MINTIVSQFKIQLIISFPVACAVVSIILVTRRPSTEADGKYDVGMERREEMEWLGVQNRFLLP